MNIGLGIVLTGPWKLFIFWFFRANFSRTKLTTIPSLDLIDQLVLHRISWLVCPRSRLFNFLDIHELWESAFILNC